jgi:hypothetical protein
MDLGIILSLLIASKVPTPRPLATMIYKVAKEEKVDSQLVTKIVIVESRGDHLAISNTGDFGLMQINLESHPNIGLVCALSPECNLRAGVKILKKFDRVCRFNVGTGKLEGKRLKNCLNYESKLDRVSLEVE